MNNTLPGKRCFIIAGPNGAGKTTFARDFLPEEGECINYINADLIAFGLSPFMPEKAKIIAGKLMLREIEKCVGNAESFALETTLSGTSYAKKIQRWQALGYKVILYYFSLPSIEVAIDRVKIRVQEGGHDIPEADIRRRFDRSQRNLDGVFKLIVDAWMIFDTSSHTPTLVDKSSNSL